ncbi:uncharacterized protein LOC142323989 isoform X2 [Lycorma delicatula]|uniref:uncharacterized protein LOC142323989 isoform X2 n=1 Tax=Lycorma delicatula TaxID=130591 RepID=UPI003F519BFE
MAQENSGSLVRGSFSVSGFQKAAIKDILQQLSQRCVVSLKQLTEEEIDCYTNRLTDKKVEHTDTEARDEKDYIANSVELDKVNVSPDITQPISASTNNKKIAHKEQNKSNKKISTSKRIKKDDAENKIDKKRRKTSGGIGVTVTGAKKRKKKDTAVNKNNKKCKMLSENLLCDLNKPIETVIENNPSIIDFKNTSLNKSFALRILTPEQLAQKTCISDLAISSSHQLSNKSLESINTSDNSNNNNNVINLPLINSKQTPVKVLTSTDNISVGSNQNIVDLNVSDQQKSTGKSDISPSAWKPISSDSYFQSSHSAAAASSSSPFPDKTINDIVMLICLHFNQPIINKIKMLSSIYVQAHNVMSKFIKQIVLIQKSQFTIEECSKKINDLKNYLNSILQSNYSTKFTEIFREIIDSFGINARWELIIILYCKIFFFISEKNKIDLLNGRRIISTLLTKSGYRNDLLSKVFMLEDSLFINLVNSTWNAINMYHSQYSGNNVPHNNNNFDAAKTIGQVNSQNSTDECITSVRSLNENSGNISEVVQGNLQHQLIKANLKQNSADLNINIQLQHSVVNNSVSSCCIQPTDKNCNGCSSVNDSSYSSSNISLNKNMPQHSQLSNTSSFNSPSLSSLPSSHSVPSSYQSSGPHNIKVNYSPYQRQPNVHSPVTGEFMQQGVHSNQNYQMISQKTLNRSDMKQFSGATFSQINQNVQPNIINNVPQFSNPQNSMQEPRIRQQFPQSGNQYKFTQKSTQRFTVKQVFDKTITSNPPQQKKNVSSSNDLNAINKGRVLPQFNNVSTLRSDNNYSNNNSSGGGSSSNSKEMQTFVRKMHKSAESQLPLPIINNGMLPQNKITNQNIPNKQFIIPSTSTTSNNNDKGSVSVQTNYDLLHLENTTKTYDSNTNKNQTITNNLFTENRSNNIEKNLTDVIKSALCVSNSPQNVNEVYSAHLNQNLIYNNNNNNNIRNNSIGNSSVDGKHEKPVCKLKVKDLKTLNENRCEITEQPESSKYENFTRNGVYLIENPSSSNNSNINKNIAESEKNKESDRVQNSLLVINSSAVPSCQQINLLETSTVNDSVSEIKREDMVNSNKGISLNLIASDNPNDAALYNLLKSNSLVLQPTNERSCNLSNSNTNVCNRTEITNKEGMDLATITPICDGNNLCSTKSLSVTPETLISFLSSNFNSNSNSKSNTVNQSVVQSSDTNSGYNSVNVSSSNTANKVVLQNTKEAARSIQKKDNVPFRREIKCRVNSCNNGATVICSGCEDVVYCSSNCQPKS